MYALVDCNNFYASCERVFNPSLNGKPVVILSNNDGCIIARSNEAKELGIEMGLPAFKSQELFAKHNVQVFSSNYVLYGDLSQRVMNILCSIAPEVEIYSIDEAFLNFKGVNITEIERIVKHISYTVKKQTGIPISIGVANTKTLAKIANKIAKKQKQHNGVYFIQSEEQRIESLKFTKIADVWGIGRQYSKFLNKHNINSAYDFAIANESWIKKNMSIVGVRTKKELEGIACIPMESVRPAKKAICTARSFGTILTEIQPLEEAVSNFAARCAEKLRRQKSCANMIMVFIHTNAFKTEEPQYATNRVVNLPTATNNSMEIIEYAKIALESIFKKGYRFKKAGVIVSGIVPENQVQTSLFDDVNRDKNKDILKVMDKINDKYGRDKVKIAAQGYGRKWKLRQEKLSPCYTTDWNSLITINAK